MRNGIGGCAIAQEITNQMKLTESRIQHQLATGIVRLTKQWRNHDPLYQLPPLASTSIDVLRQV
jgi:hypothetical protein